MILNLIQTNFFCKVGSEPTLMPIGNLKELHYLDKSERLNMIEDYKTEISKLRRKIVILAQGAKKPNKSKAKKPLESLGDIDNEKDRTEKYIKEEKSKFEQSQRNLLMKKAVTTLHNYNETAVSLIDGLKGLN